MDSDKSPLRKWDLLHESYHPYLTDFCDAGYGLCKRIRRKEYLSQPQLFQLISPMFQHLCIVTLSHVLKFLQINLNSLMTYLSGLQQRQFLIVPSCFVASKKKKKKKDYGFLLSCLHKPFPGKFINATLMKCYKHS